MFKNYLKIVLSITSNQIRCFIKTQLLLTIALLICNGSCNAQQSTYHYITPSSLNDGLQVASAKSVGIKENDLEKLAQRIMNGDLGYLRAIVLIKDGNLFYE